MIDILSIGFTDNYTGTGATKNTFAMGSIGDILQATITLSVHWETLQVPMKFESTTKTIIRGYYGSTDAGSFIDDGFQANDTITIAGTVSNNGNFNIVSVTKTVITVSNTLVNETASLTDIHGTTPVNAFDFYYNLVPNNTGTNFNSLTDFKNAQKQTASKSTWNNGDTVTLNCATTSKGWVTSINDTITRTSSGTYPQLFTVVNTFKIAPLYLANQFNLITAGLPPGYYAGGYSLQYVCRADAKFVINSPSQHHTTDPNYPFELGNVGWFNEFLNGGTPEYSLTSISYLDTVTSLPVTSPDFQNDTQVTMVINSANANFIITPTATKLNLNFIYCPGDQADFVNTPTKLDQNYKLDSLLFSLGASSANGVNFGTDYQAIKSITSVRNSASQATITFTISLSTATKNFLKTKGSSNRNFLFWVTPQKGTITNLLTADRNAVFGDFNSFSYNQDDTTLLSWNDIKFYQYPDVTTNAYTDYKGFIGDQLLVKSQFLILKNATPKNIIINILAVNSVTGESFSLQKYATSLLSKTDSNGVVCLPISQTFNYQLSSDDPRNQFLFERNSALDTGSQYGYEIDYGFMLRYETWRTVPGVSKAFICNDSEKWSNYSMATNWGIKFQISMDVLNVAGDYLTNFTRNANIKIADDTLSQANNSGINTFIDTYRLVNMAYVDMVGTIANDENTHVKATFKGNFSSFPIGYNEYYGYIALDVEGSGGETFIDKTTTEDYPLTSSRWLNRATLTVVSTSQIIIEADIDYTTLDTQTEKYIISARLGYKKV